MTTESDLRHKVDIKEDGELGGTQIIEEDITVERKHSSVTTGEDSVSNFQVSIVREKHPVSVVYIHAYMQTLNYDTNGIKVLCACVHFVQVFKSSYCCVKRFCCIHSAKRSLDLSCVLAFMAKGIAFSSNSNTLCAILINNNIASLHHM